jgi:quercetin dioxygenase-like cupin family protein
MTKADLRTIGQGDVWNVFGETIIRKVSGEETFGRFSVVEETSLPGSVVPPHLHHQTDEIIYVLEGAYEFQIAEEKIMAKQGDLLVIPRGTIHSFGNSLDAPSKLLAIITPSGFENFFAGIDKLKEPEMAEIIELGRQNDLELAL